MKLLLAIWRNLFGKVDEHPTHCCHFHGTRPALNFARYGYCCICKGRNPNIIPIDPTNDGGEDN